MTTTLEIQRYQSKRIHINIFEFSTRKVVRIASRWYPELRALDMIVPETPGTANIELKRRDINKITIHKNRFLFPCGCQIEIGKKQEEISCKAYFHRIDSEDETPWKIVFEPKIGLITNITRRTSSQGVLHHIRIHGASEMVDDPEIFYTSSKNFSGMLSMAACGCRRIEVSESDDIILASTTQLVSIILHCKIHEHMLEKSKYDLDRELTKRSAPHLLMRFFQSYSGGKELMKEIRNIYGTKIANKILTGGS